MMPNMKVFNKIKIKNLLWYITFSTNNIQIKKYRNYKFITFRFVFYFLFFSRNKNKLYTNDFMREILRPKGKFTFIF